MKKEIKEKIEQLKEYLKSSDKGYEIACIMDFILDNGSKADYSKACRIGEEHILGIH